ncbi:hypothetical protein OtV5_010c [Ostreococcus tauri virus OtV5]|uniref:Uncharacterized protein n=1 Tax=Ostreococcus tauri virus OtV5 TaxID=1785753 RepID=A9YVQ8_9PHYC|nr:hypothetical protein OtV5_010c [Ostreococcus tauri virus OtV5]ABY27791.2 hypothetical protein OtV5_010c [Ostreococcus tauri virus OtV5]
MNNNQRKCVDGSTIYYNLETIPENVVTKGPFEAVFLGNVINEMSEGCLFIKQQCKSQYPVVNDKNWRQWITSIDQENRISLAHTIEKSGIPILYNTPRLCDPGISVSKNWSLRNYIETRLYMFKFVYDYGRNFKPTGNAACYPTNIFDFRPFQYKLALPGSEKPLYVTEYITVDKDTKKAAFTPHMAISKFQIKSKFSSTEQIFEDMVKFVIVGEEYGKSRSSISNQSYYLGPSNNSGMNVSNFMNGFKKFIQEYDRVKFVGEGGLLNNRTGIQTINLTDDVMRVMFYDLIHDGVITKSYKFSTFKKKFIGEFKNFKGFDNGIVSFKEWVGATTAANSWKAYKTILEPTREVKTKRVKDKNVQIKQFPAIFKTLGDLSQFMYASRYGSIVASGDKMGLGAGLYINAKNGRTVKCMMEDAITGFILYTGMRDINFTTKSGCGNLRNTNTGTCLMKNDTNVKPATIAKQIIQSIPQNQKSGANAIVAAKPQVPGGKRLIKLWLNQDLSGNTATTVLNTIDKFKNFWDDSDIVKIKTVLTKMQSGNRITNSNKFRASQLMGQLNAATPNGGTPVKRPRANNATTTNKRLRANNATTTNKRPRANNTTTTKKRPRANNATPNNNRNTNRVTRAGTLFGQPQRLKTNSSNRPNGS